MTYVNDIGHSTYVEYKSGANFPIGSIAIKESYKIKANGNLTRGPLLAMEKVGLEKAPKTGGWFYSGTTRNGGKMGVSQKFCHNCHKNYAQNDFMGYPVESVRIK